MRRFGWIVEKQQALSPNFYDKTLSHLLVLHEVHSHVIPTGHQGAETKQPQLWEGG